VPARPEVLVQLRNVLIADAEGLDAHRRQYENTRLQQGEGGKVRRSRQAVACRKRSVQELGKPHELLTVGRGGRRAYGYLGTQGETRTQSQAGAYTPQRNAGQEGGGVLSKGKPPDAAGVSYQA
jgi:hypothetical protein